MDNIEQKEVVAPERILTHQEEAYALIERYYKASFSTIIIFMLFAFVPFVKFSKIVMGYFMFKIVALTLPALLVAIFLMFLFIKEKRNGAGKVEYSVVKETTIVGDLMVTDSEL